MINFKLKTLLISCHKDQGFALILALITGSIMILATTATIATLQKENVIEYTEGETSRALNVAKRGFTRYLQVINSNKFIAQHPACATTWDSNGVCQDSGTEVSWAQADKIPGIEPACPGGDATTIKNWASREWRDLDPIDPVEGQFRLIDYTFNPNEDPANPGTFRPFGTLTIEGRVNPGPNDEEAVNTATARIKQDIPIQPGLPPVPAIGVSLIADFNGLNPALWIGNNSGNDVGNLKVDNGNILLSDANCNIFVGSGNPDFSHADSIVGDPRVLSSSTDPLDVNTPDLPSLPGEYTTITNTDLAAVDHQLPRLGDPTDSNNYYHYLVEGDLDLGGEELKIRESTKVILYVQGQTVKIDANVNLNASENTSAYLEIYGNYNTSSGYKYGCNAAPCGTTEVILNNDIDVKAFLHAPAATLKDNGTAATVDWTGAIWVKNVNTPNSSLTITPDRSYYNYTTIINMNTANQRLVEPILSAPISFQQLEVE